MRFCMPPPRPIQGKVALDLLYGQGQGAGPDGPHHRDGDAPGRRSGKDDPPGTAGRFPEVPLFLQGIDVAYGSGGSGGADVSGNFP